MEGNTPIDQVRESATQVLDDYALGAADSLQLAASLGLVRTEYREKGVHLRRRTPV
jgi:transposase